MYIKYIIRSNSSWNLLEILIFFICLIDTSRVYQIVSVEDDDSCLNLSKGSITLGNGKLSRLIVSLDNITSSEQQKGKWEDDFVCEFKVSTSHRRETLFAVIQNIFLRKNYTTNECIDYVEYKRYDDTISEKYCGQMGIDYHLEANDTVVITNPFAQQHPSSIKVHINISKTPLKPDENLELEIVFTSHRDCLQAYPYGLFDNCQKEFTVHCIATNLSNDGYLNCPYYRCTNESICAKYATKTSSQESNISAYIYPGFVLIFLVLIIIYCVLKTLCHTIVNTGEDSDSEYHDAIPEDNPPEYYEVVSQETPPPPYSSLNSEQSSDTSDNSSDVSDNSSDASDNSLD